MSSVTEMRSMRSASLLGGRSDQRDERSTVEASNERGRDITATDKVNNGIETPPTRVIRRDTQHGRDA